MGVKKKTASKQWALAGEPVYTVRLSPAEERAFKEPLARMRDSAAQMKEENPGFSRSVSFMKRNEEAAKASIGYFFQLFDQKYPREVIADALAKAAALPGPVEEHYAQSTHYMLGAALWFLDYARQHDLGQELLKLLPVELDEDTDFATPDVDDLNYGRDDMLGMMTIFLRRQKDQRQVFRKLWGLVDKKTATALKETFRDALQDYFDRYLEVCSRIKPSTRADLEMGGPLLRASSLPDGLPFMDLPNDPAEEAPVKRHPDLWFLMHTPLLVGAASDRIRKSLYYRRASELMEGFQVQDPYTVCAAYLLLERDGDVLANLNMLTVNVLICAERHLPWGIGGDYNYAEPSEDGTAECALQYTYHPHENAEEEDLPDPDIEPGDRLSEHQLFYLATGYALPRNQVPSRRLRDWFMEQGLPEIRAEALAWGAWFASYVDDLRVLGDVTHWDDFLDDPEDEWEEENEEGEGEDEGEEEDAEHGETVDSAVQVEELTWQLKATRQALHEAEQNVRQLQQRLQSTETDSLRDRAELSQLRETLFELRSREEQPEDKPDPEIEFPYQTKRRIVSFGGHDTWRKAIRPMLPDVRFFDRELMPDINTIKGADVVWIQTNAISHKFYYRIIDTARKEDIPVRYFGTASARKCAEQVVMEELAAEEN